MEGRAQDRVVGTAGTTPAGTDGRDGEPRGFGGWARDARTLLEPSGGDPCVLPRDAERHGPFLAVPDGPHAAVHVESLAEGFGDVRRFFAALAERTADGARVLVDAANAQGVAALRTVLEGAPGSLEPAGSLLDPERPVTARSLLGAVASAGLVPLDLYRMRDGFEIGPRFAQAMFREGMFPTGYLRGVPPRRFWLVAERCRARPAVSALVGPGAPQDVEATVAAVRSAFDDVLGAGALDAMPPTGEVVLAAAGSDEPEGFDEALTRSRGDLVWLLRAGSRPTASDLRALLDAAMVAPALPAASEGDVCGLLASRVDVLLTGPLAAARDAYRVLPIAYEDWRLRLESAARAPQSIECGFVPPPVPCGAVSPQVYREDADRLFASWEALEDEGAVGFAAVPRSDDTLAALTGTAGGAVPPSGAAARTGAGAAVDAEPGRRPTLALCLIAKDEEESLPGCLEAAAPICDEIVLFDTGSTDRTVEIAESYGARVVRGEWRDDFAWARNRSLEQVTADWVLTLDADEVLTADARTKILEGIRRPDVCGYHLVISNVFEGRAPIEVLIVRLFRNLPGVVWKNRIHEQVSPSLTALGAERGMMLSMLDARVEHHGYQEETIRDRGKDERNERIFLQQLADDPEDVYNLYKYGDFLRRLPGRNADATRALEQAMDHILRTVPGAARGMPFAGEVAALLALEYGRNGDLERSRRVLDLAQRRFVPTPNLHYVSAGVAQAVGSYAEAIAHYERCLEYRGRTLVVPIQDGITGRIAFAGIAKACVATGDLLRAQRLLEHVLRNEPDDAEATVALARLHVARNDLGAALGVLTSHLARDPGCVAVCEETTVLLARIGRPVEARRLGARTASLLEAGDHAHEAARLRAMLASLEEPAAATRPRSSVAELPGGSPSGSELSDASSEGPSIRA